MTRQSPLERLLSLIGAPRPARRITLRTAEEIDALIDRLRPTLAELGKAELQPAALARLRGLRVRQSPTMLDAIARAMTELPTLARQLNESPERLRAIGELVLHLPALERAFLAIYEGADNALLQGLGTAQEQLDAVLGAAEARVTDGGRLDAEARAQFTAHAPPLSVAADVEPAAQGEEDEREAVATFLRAVRAARGEGEVPAADLALAAV